MNSLCDYCGNFVMSIGFIPKGVSNTLSDEFIDRLRKVNTNYMLRLRKLHLVLDLNHTLLALTKLCDLTPEEEEYLNNTQTLQDVFKVQAPDDSMSPMIIKLRPFVRTFLSKASDMFEMYVYEDASQSLVRKMVELLDPKNDYFGQRVISREDYFWSNHMGKKHLDLVLGQESAVLILGDNLEAWTEQNQKNIAVPVQKYPFFKQSCGQKSRRKSLCELKNDEGGIYLANVLRRLRRIHSMFFNDQVMCDEVFNRDVRMVLKSVEWISKIDKRKKLKSVKMISKTDKLLLRKKALSNCMWKKSDHRKKKKTEKMEEQSPEASYVEKLEDPESSVVAAAADDVGTSPAPWVHPSWIEKSIHLWKKSHADKGTVITEEGEFSCSSYWNSGIDNQRGNEGVALGRPEK
ncbi:putative protein-serine/threonine phosphatase [Rosa chinensis]|uniref:protein-serine/threonine phosphatase n=1 Tax=Rosa chinensis TaxID=74649 RepID=A0A2P6P4V6_ROSCH|nr:RNA polymerase II C-terminal domain phosphatase-like 4 [Rosa chinensis]PRQ16965.1 putative protein-serine/threonine phosphatase [Rosa chinensis]